MPIENLYIVAIDEPTLTRLPVQYTPPTIEYKREGRFDAVAIVGRNEDLRHYSGGSTSLSMSLDFYAANENKKSAMQAVAFLESLVYSESERPPSRVKIIFGDLFPNSVWVLVSASVSLSQFEKNSNWLPRYATIQCSFVRDTAIDLTAREIRQQYG